MRRSWLTALALLAGAWLLTASRCENTQTGPTTSTPTATPTPTGPTPTATLTPTGTTATPTGSTTGTPTLTPTATPAVTPTGGQTATPTPTGPTPTATLTPTGTTATPTGSTTGTPTLTPTASASAFAGNWKGQWKNNTSNTSGGATMIVSVNASAQTFEGAFDLTGNVFGSGDPPSQTFFGTYNSSGGSFNVNSAFYGIMSFSITSAGGIFGNLTSLPISSVSRVDFSGIGTPQSILLNYTITFTAGGIATGTLTLDHT